MSIDFRKMMVFNHDGFTYIHILHVFFRTVLGDVGKSLQLVHHISPPCNNLERHHLDKLLNTDRALILLIGTSSFITVS